jgi:hypothetical protein
VRTALELHSGARETIVSAGTASPLLINSFVYDAPRSPIAVWGLRFLIAVILIGASSPLIGFVNALTGLTILGFTAAVAGLQRPVLGIFGIGMLCVIDSLTRALLMTGGLFRYNTLNYLLLLACLLSLRTVSRLRDEQTRALQAFVLLLCVASIMSPDLHSASFAILNVAAEMGLILYFVRASGDLQIYYWLAVVNGCLAAIMCLALFHQTEVVSRVNPNAWAYLPLTALFSICMGLRFAESGMERFLLVLLTVVNCTWVFLSASRGSMIVALICGIYIVQATKGVTLKVSFILFGVALALTVVTFFSDMQAYAIKRVNKLFDDKYNMKSRTSGRSELAETGVEMFASNPFGEGTGAFATELADVVGYHKQAHSAWVKTAVENGVAGLVTLGFYVLSFALTGRRKRFRGAMGLGIVATLSLATAFCSTEFTSKGLWWLAAGCTALFHYSIPDEDESSYPVET